MNMKNNSHKQEIKDRWLNIHHTALPNYLKTFNHRCPRDAMPVLTKFNKIRLAAK